MKTAEEILEYVNKEIEDLEKKTMESSNKIEFIGLIKEQVALLKLKNFIRWE